MERPREVRGLWSDAWRRLRKNKAAVVGLGLDRDHVRGGGAWPPVLAPHDPNDIPSHAMANSPPVWDEGGSWEFPLGTDSLARDELSRLIYGARISMIVGIVPTMIVVVIGVTYGLLPVGLVAAGTTS